MSLDHSPTRPDDCLSSSTTPVLCLRFDSSRERLALPYASLVMVSLSTDETVMNISFVTHRVTIKGRKLAEVYIAVAAGSAVAVAVGQKEFSTSLKSFTPDRLRRDSAALAITNIWIEQPERRFES